MALMLSDIVNNGWEKIVRQAKRAVSELMILSTLATSLAAQNLVIDGSVVDKKKNPVEHVLAIIANEETVEDSSFTNNLGQYLLTIATVGVEDDFIPLKFSLGQNYPNPFNPTTRIDVSTLNQGSVSIYNIPGQVVDRVKLPETSVGRDFCINLGWW